MSSIYYSFNTYNLHSSCLISQKSKPVILQNFSSIKSNSSITERIASFLEKSSFNSYPWKLIISNEDNYDRQDDKIIITEHFLKILSGLNNALMTTWSLIIKNRKKKQDLSFHSSESKLIEEILLLVAHKNLNKNVMIIMDLMALCNDEFPQSLICRQFSYLNCVFKEYFLRNPSPSRLRFPNIIRSILHKYKELLFLEYQIWYSYLRSSLESKENLDPNLQLQNSMTRKKRSLNLLEISTSSQMHHSVGINHEDELENHEKSSTASGSFRDGKEIHTETSGTGSGNSEESDFHIGYEESLNNRKYNLTDFSRGVSPEAIKSIPHTGLMELYDGCFVGDLEIYFDPSDLVCTSKKLRTSYKSKTAYYNQTYNQNYNHKYLNQSQRTKPKFEGKPYNYQQNSYQHKGQSIHERTQQQRNSQDIIHIPLFTLPPSMNFGFNLQFPPQTSLPSTQIPRNSSNNYNLDQIRINKPHIEVNAEPKHEKNTSLREQRKQVPTQNQYEEKEKGKDIYKNEQNQQTQQKERTKTQESKKHKSQNLPSNSNMSPTQKNDNQEKNLRIAKKTKSTENSGFKLWDMLKVNEKLQK